MTTAEYDSREPKADSYFVANAATGDMF